MCAAAEAELGAGGMLPEDESGEGECEVVAAYTGVLAVAAVVERVRVGDVVVSAEAAAGTSDGGVLAGEGATATNGTCTDVGVGAVGADAPEGAVGTIGVTRG